MRPTGQQYIDAHVTLPPKIYHRCHEQPKIPKRTRSKSIIASDDYHWQRQDALAAVDFLEKRHKPVVGVELFQKEGEKWRTIALSTYDTTLQRYADIAPEQKSDYIALACRLARKFITEAVSDESEYFLLTWLD